MFSDHIPKIAASKFAESPVKAVLFIIAGVVIVCQLVAMVMLAGGQVEKANLRDASQASARAVTVWCLESSRGAALRDCDRSLSSFSAQAGADQGNISPQGINLVTLGNR